MNTKTIKFDLNKYKLYEKIKAKQGDTKSRFLLFQLLDGSIPFNLKNRSVRAYMIKPDGREIFNDLIVNNYNLGYCTLELTNQVLAAQGIVKIELMVTEGDKKLTSSVFELEVVKSINSEKSIVSTNEFTALLNGLAALSEYDNYKNSVKEMEINKANKAEVEEKFISVEEKIKNNSEQLEQTVRKGEGGSVTWAMASQDFRENVTGGNTAVVGKDSVLKENIVDGEVIKSKASFYKKTRNLFDKEKAIYGKYVSSTTGELTTPSVEGTFYASDYVEVINGSKYNYRAKDNSYTLYAFYNNDKQFINGGNSNGTDIISPVDGFIRVSVWKNVDVDTVQFELGDATEYIEPYILEVEEEVANIKPKIEKVLEN